MAKKLYCTFKIDVPDLGHLDGGAQQDVSQCVVSNVLNDWSYNVLDQINTGNRIQLPFWLVPLLLYSYVANGYSTLILHDCVARSQIVTFPCHLDSEFEMP